MVKSQQNRVLRSSVFVGMVQGLTGSLGAIATLLLLTPAVYAEAASEAVDTGEPMEAIAPPHLTDLDQPATTVEAWIAQIEASLVQITAVRVEATEAGLQVVLETAEGELAVSETRSIGNALIADIPNARIAEAFSQAEPIEGIVLVSVTGLPGDRVRVAITGTDAPPVAEVRSEAQGLVLAVTTGEARTAVEEDAIQVVVTGEQEEGYNPRSASTATRTDTPLRDIPQSVQIVPQQVIEDRQAGQISDALENVSGVVTGLASQGLADRVTVRGFTISGGNNFLRNGIPDPNAVTLGTFANVERIELLRGPASVLYGSGVPGGTVNVVTEQPLDTPSYEISATAGSYNFYSGEIDLTGPLNPSRTVLYRLNTSYRDFDSFVDFQNPSQGLIAPSLSFAIGENTNLTVEAEYLFGEYARFYGLPAVGTVLPNPNGDFPRDRYVGEPDNNLDTVTTYRAGYRLEHRFSDNWSLRNSFLATLQTYFSPENVVYPTSLAEDNRTLNRGFLTAGLSSNNFNFNTDLLGRFSTGSIQHQLLVGFDLNRSEDNSDYVFGTAAPIDVFNPDYGQPLGSVDFEIDEFLQRDTLGIYVQDQVRFADNLLLLLGLRFDTTQERLDNFLAGTSTSQSDSAFSPRVGIVYQPIPAVSLYASYSRSFVPVTGLSRNGSQFEPERGTQYEAGVKVDISDQLSATLAFFDLTRSNVLTSDLTNPEFSIQTGEQRSQGIEFNVAGEILPGWNIIAGYAYTDARITEDNTFEEGNQLSNAPRNAANFWTTYRIQSGDLQGLGFGLGFNFVGDRQGDLNNSFELPSYFRTDAALFYERDQFRAALNFRNLFDVDYFESALNRNRVYPASPFEIQATVSWEF